MSDEMVEAVRVRLEAAIPGSTISASTTGRRGYAVYLIERKGQTSRLRVSSERFEDYSDAERIVPDLIVAKASIGNSFRIDSADVITFEDFE